MAKQVLKVVTEAGEFTRTTATEYTHIVVRTSQRAKAYVDGVAAGTVKVYNNGVHARWMKDRGFAVTWHKSEHAAQVAAATGSKWDGVATLVGIFPVETPLIDDNGGTEWIPIDPAITAAQDEILLARRRNR